MWHFMALIDYLYFGEGFVPPFLYVGLVLVRRKCQFSCSCKQCIHILSGILKNDLVINLCNNGLSTLYYSSCSCRRINRWGRGWTSYSTPWSSCWISFSIKCRISYKTMTKLIAQVLELDIAKCFLMIKINNIVSYELISFYVSSIMCSNVIS